MKLTKGHIIPLLKEITKRRFFASERGYQGNLIYLLENYIKETGILPPETIVEQEHQKTVKHHSIRQRPDIILHIPVEAGLTNDRTENNYYVIALKLNGQGKHAVDDYKKLNEMFSKLNYPEGVFINIGSYPDIYLNNYKGDFKNRIHELSVGLENGNVIIQYARFYKEKLIITKH